MCVGSAGRRVKNGSLLSADFKAGQILAGPVGPAGNATFPQAQTGFLCIYEESKTNSVGVTLNAVNRSGATIFTNSSAPGGFFSYGTWAATGS
jgi:hypothetical protein